MSDPETHHYLPVFYLKQWAAIDGKVMRYYRPHNEVVAHPIAPKNTGYEPGLYGLEGYAADQRNTIEKNFMGPEVDCPAAEALRFLIERRPATQLTLPLRQAWTRFLMSLHVRHPGRVRQITEQAAAGLRQSFLEKPEEYEAVRGADDPPTLLEYVEKYTPVVLSNFGKQLLPGIITHQAIGTEILRMKWGVFGIAGASFDVLTSDRPLFLSHGISDERCVMALPLSPKAVFFASRSAERLDSIEAHGGDTVVRSVNESMVGQAERYVYGAHERHLRFVERLLPCALLASVLA